MPKIVHNHEQAENMSQNGLWDPWLLEKNQKKKIGFLGKWSESQLVWKKLGLAWQQIAMIWRLWAFSGPNILNATKKTFNLAYWTWKMAHWVGFYEQKCKKNEKIWKIHFFDPCVKIDPNKAQKGSQMAIKGHIPSSYTAIGWFWWFLAKNLRLTEKIVHLGWNYSYGKRQNLHWRVTTKVFPRLSLSIKFKVDENHVHHFPTCSPHPAMLCD